MIIYAESKYTVELFQYGMLKYRMPRVEIDWSLTSQVLTQALVEFCSVNG